MSCVLDASLTVAWIHPWEWTLPIEHAMSIANAGAWVPSLWKLEVANVLQMNVRRNRYTAAQRDQFLHQLSRVKLNVDPSTDAFCWSTTVQLAHQHQLTVYDAAYLELAMRRHLPLATLDNDLRNAALQVGVPLLGR